MNWIPQQAPRREKDKKVRLILSQFTQSSSASGQLRSKICYLQRPENQGRHRNEQIQSCALATLKTPGLSPSGCFSPVMMIVPIPQDYCEG